jgi:hypothetical protein
MVSPGAIHAARLDHSSKTTFGTSPRTVSHCIQILLTDSSYFSYSVDRPRAIARYHDFHLTTQHITAATDGSTNVSRRRFDHLSSAVWFIPHSSCIICHLWLYHWLRRCLYGFIMARESPGCDFDTPIPIPIPMLMPPIDGSMFGLLDSTGSRRVVLRCTLAETVIRFDYCILRSYQVEQRNWPPRHQIAKTGFNCAICVNNNVTF